jgi:hypothetical protein
MAKRRNDGSEREPKGVPENRLPADLDRRSFFKAAGLGLAHFVFLNAGGKRAFAGGEAGCGQGTPDTCAATVGHPDQPLPAKGPAGADECFPSLGDPDDCYTLQGDPDECYPSVGDRDECYISQAEVDECWPSFGDPDECYIFQGEIDECAPYKGDRDQCYPTEGELDECNPQAKDRDECYPQEGDPDWCLEAYGDFDECAPYKGESVTKTPSKQKTIGPDGGTIDDGRGTSIVFPPGSLSEPTDIYILSPSFGVRTTSDGKRIAAVRQFAPDGLALAVPAQVTMPYTPTEADGLLEGSLRAYGWDSELLEWQPIPSMLNMSSRAVRFHTDHFSLFGIGGTPAPVGGIAELPDLAQTAPAGHTLLGVIAGAVAAALSLFGAGWYANKRNSDRAV